MTTRPPTPCGSGPVQCKFAVQPGLLTQPPPGASAICCNTWLQLAGPSHGAMQIRCAVRLCNLAPRPARHWLNFRRPLHCGCVSRRSPLRLRFAKRLQFRQARLAPNSCLPSARSLHFRHRTARPKPAGPVRWLVSAARRRQSRFGSHTRKSGLADSGRAAQAHITTGRHISPACYGNARKLAGLRCPVEMCRPGQSQLLRRAQCSFTPSASTSPLRLRCSFLRVCAYAVSRASVVSLAHSTTP